MVIAYFFAVTGLAFIGVNLSLVVAAKVIALSLPHIASQIEPPTSRVEQRRVAAAQAIPPMPVAKLAALQESAVPYDVLAAQLDSAEAEDVHARPVIAGRKRLGAGAAHALQGQRAGGGRLQPQLRGLPRCLELMRSNGGQLAGNLRS